MLQKNFINKKDITSASRANLCLEIYITVTLINIYSSKQNQNKSSNELIPKTRKTTRKKSISKKQEETKQAA